MTQAFQPDSTHPLTLTLGHLYPDQLNLYGDRGNIMALRHRCEQRGIRLHVVGIGVGDALLPDEYDMLFIGGGQDREQAPVARDLNEIKGIGLWAAVEDDMPVLAVCGGFQLLAHYYRPATGPDMRGLGIFDAWTIHQGSANTRCIGDIAIRWGQHTLVGFENHGGKTYLGTAQPLGRVLKGYGNNAEDGTEGAIYRHAYGTYLHGSLLPKNPHFTDHLIQLALQRKYRDSVLPIEGISDSTHSAQSTKTSASSTEREIDRQPFHLTPLDDRLEWRAHASILERLGLHSASTQVLRAYNSYSIA